MGLFDFLKKKDDKISDSKDVSKEIKNEQKTYECKQGFSVVWASNYQDNFKKVLTRNKNYDIATRRIKEDVYEYYLFSTYDDVELIEEPTNPYDPKAIKVVYKGLLLGYIKKGSTSRVRNIMKNDYIIKINFYGGNVKGWLADRYIEEKKILNCKITIFYNK